MVDGDYGSWEMGQYYLAVTKVIINMCNLRQVNS